MVFTCNSVLPLRINFLSWGGNLKLKRRGTTQGNRTNVQISSKLEKPACNTCSRKSIFIQARLRFILILN